MVVPRAARATGAWPPVLVERLPGQARLPWVRGQDARVEMWRIDLLEIDRPEVAAWLADWEPRPGLLARRVPLEPGAAAGGGLPVSRPGAYVVRSASQGEASNGLLLASRLRMALLLEDCDLEVLCADARSGQPVQGAFVRVVYRTERLGADTVLSASGTTDATGRWHTSVVRDRFAPLVVATAVAVHDNHFALATARRALDHGDAHVRLTLRARRPVFHAGQLAEITGVLQRREGARFAPMPNAPLSLTLRDPEGRPAGTLRVRTSAVGAFTEGFQLAKDAAPGPYRVVAAVGELPVAEPQEFQLFRVLPRQRTPFRLKLSVDRPVVAPGEAITLRLTARTAEGQPLPDVPVRLLSWGYPVSLEGQPAWARGAAPIDESRVVVLPAPFPAEARTTAEGTLELRWQPGRGDVPPGDLLCGLQATVAAPRLGTVRRTAEFLLLGALPPLQIAPSGEFLEPSEPFHIDFLCSLAPEQRKGERATCTVSYEDPPGRQHALQLLDVTLDGLAGRRLAVTASQPGRYAFEARAAGVASEAVVWVMRGGQPIPWSGAATPRLIPERPWCRRGEPLQTILAGARDGGPIALTLRSAAHVQRESFSVPAGARGVRLRLDEAHAGPVEVTLLQVSQGAVREGHATLGIEPGGRTLDITADLAWVKKGEFSGRGYLITSSDRLGNRVQAIVHPYLIRPTFEGVPPAAVRRHTVHWQGVKPTGHEGQIRLGVADTVLSLSYALFVQALAPDGRAGALLLPAHVARGAAPSGTGPTRSPEAKLGALARHGLDDPVARWLAGRLIAREPRLASALPDLVATATTDDAALRLLRLATSYPGAALSALEAALRRSPAIRPAALAAAADVAAEARPVLQDILATDPSPETRRVAVGLLGRVLPLNVPILIRSLRDDADPTVRAAAATALGYAGETAVAALAEAAGRETVMEVRLAVARGLRRAGGRGAAEALLGMLDDGESEIALVALRSLAAIGYRGTDPRLLRLLHRGNGTLQGEAARVLAQAGTLEATRALAAAAHKAPTAALVEALGTLRSKSVRASMVQWLRHEDAGVRLAAAEYLAALKDPRAFPVLRDLLVPAIDAPLADRAAQALLARRNEAAAARLIQMLDAGRLSQATRLTLIRTAGELGWREAAGTIVAILARGLAEPQRLDQAEERQLWAEALRAAARVGPIWDAEVERAVPDVPGDSPYAPALAALRADGVAGLLRALWRSPLPDDLRRATVAAYARLRGKAAGRELVPLLESPVLQGAATRALADIEAVEALLVALSHRSPYTRGAAAAALGAIGDIRAVPALDPLLEDADGLVRMEAAHALAAITHRPVIYTDHLGAPRQAAP